MDPVDLFWTSGWDSTFRLLDAALSRGRVVRPHYIVDPTRHSWERELATMKAILQATRQHLPDVQIDEPIVSQLRDVPPMPAIQQAFQRLRAQRRLGTQYDWLARYAWGRQLAAPELGTEKDGGMYKAVFGLCTLRDPDGDSYYALRADHMDSDLGRLFGQFRFPVLGLSKQQMRDLAAAGGFLDLLEMSWFCHHPTAQGEPCGICIPCQFAIREGLSYRLPAGALRRFRYQRFYRPLSRLRGKLGFLAGKPSTP